MCEKSERQPETRTLTQTRYQVAARGTPGGGMAQLIVVASGRACWARPPRTRRQPVQRASLRAPSSHRKV